MHDYYEILGIEASATEDAIRTVIRTTRKRYRQVAGSPNKEQARNAEIMMDRLAEAETELLDAGRRRAYDAKLAAQPEPKQERSNAGSNDWVETAKNYLANGQPRNAVQAARQATLAAPEDIEAWTVRAYAALELRDYTDADFAASEAERRDPRNPEIAGLLGDVYDGESRYQQAEQAFARAAQLDPENPYWQGRVAWALCDQGRIAEALTRARQISARFPQSDYAKKVHSFILLEDAAAALSRDGDGTYFTNKKQLAHVQGRLEEVTAVGGPEGSTLEYYNHTSDSLKSAKKRQFHRITVRRIIANLLLVLFTLSLLFNESVGSGIFFLLITGLFVWWTVEKCWPYQWKINKKALGAAARTGLQ